MNTPTRRLILAGLALLPAAAYAQTQPKAKAPTALSPADQASVDRAVAYLQGLTLARGRFTQIDSRGRRAPGDFYLNRPGKVRFDFDAPNALLIVSDGNQVAVRDGKLGTFEAYPLRSTPLAIFLAREIRLNGARVTRVERAADAFTITVQNREGQIALKFANEPVRLKEWTVTDTQRQQTRVVLDTLAPASALDPALFRFTAPRTSGTAKS